MILENVKVQWAKLGDNADNKYMSDEKQWSIDALLTDDQANKWVESGVKPSVKVKDGVKSVSLRKDCVWKKSGDPKKAPMVVDQFGDPIDATIIGNDSVCNIQFSVRDWEFQGTKGRSAELVAVQVLELVEYTGGADTLAFAFNEKKSAPLADEDVPF
jgi:ribosomal protein S16